MKLFIWNLLPNAVGSFGNYLVVASAEKILTKSGDNEENKWKSVSSVNSNLLCHEIYGKEMAIFVHDSKYQTINIIGIYVIYVALAVPAQILIFYKAFDYHYFSNAL